MSNGPSAPLPRPRRCPWRLVVCAALLWLGPGLRAAPVPASSPSKGKTYVITGASSGFGRGVAVELGRRGGNVVLAARRAGVLREVAREVRAAGGAALVVPTDVSRPEQVERLARAAVARFGRVDVWINDAAVGINGRFWEIPVADAARAVDVNLKGVIYGSHAALRQFVAQGGGTLINLGSVESVVPVAYHNVYAATKAGILALDMAIIQELRLSGLGDRIKVATIMPWAVDTPWWGHAANYLGRTPRMVAVDDPAKVVRAIVDNTERPSAEVPVGWKAQGAYLGHRLSPDLTTRIAANLYHRETMGKGAPTPATTGSLYRPMAAGQGVEGGVRARMKWEDRERAGRGER